MPGFKHTPGVVTGDQLSALYDDCQTKGCALPAVNVVGSHSVNASLAAAREVGCPIIIQLSHGGAHFFGGKFLSKDEHAGPIAGGVAGALYVRAVAEAYGVSVVLHTDHAAKKLLPWIDGLVSAGEDYFERHGEPLFSSHMLDLSEETLEDNLAISAEYLTRLAKIGMSLEIELGVTGGEEDGVDNTEIDNAKLYTQPSDVLAAYEKLKPVGPFTVAASFGNTHGVYKPGNVKLTPKILENSQAAVVAKHGGGDDRPVHFVFHGGSGSTREEIREAVGYGVVKMNIDTDTQWDSASRSRSTWTPKMATSRLRSETPRATTSPTRSTSTRGPGFTWASKGCATGWSRRSRTWARPASSSGRSLGDRNTAGRALGCGRQSVSHDPVAVLRVDRLGVATVEARGAALAAEALVHRGNVEVGQRVHFQRLGSTLFERVQVFVEAPGEELGLGRHVDAVEAGVAHRGGVDRKVHAFGPGIPQQCHHSAQGGASNDRVVDQQDPTPAELRGEGIELELERRGSGQRIGHDEGATAVAVLDEPLAHWNRKRLGEGCGRGPRRVRDRDHDVDIERLGLDAAGEGAAQL